MTDKPEDPTADVFSAVINSDATDEAKTAAWVGHLMSQNYRQYADLTQAVIVALERERDEARRELRAVRARIEALCRQPWSPSPRLILDALYGPVDMCTYGRVQQ